jgi:hypothetical protein
MPPNWLLRATKLAEDAARQLRLLLAMGSATSDGLSPLQQLHWQPCAAPSAADVVMLSSCSSVLQDMDAALLQEVQQDASAAAQMMQCLLGQQAARSVCVVLNWVQHQPEQLIAAVQAADTAGQARDDDTLLSVWWECLVVLNKMAQIVASMERTAAAAAASAATMTQQMEQAGV